MTTDQMALFYDTYEREYIAAVKTMAAIQARMDRNVALREVA